MLLLGVGAPSLTRSYESVRLEIRKKESMRLKSTEEQGTADKEKRKKKELKLGISLTRLAKREELIYCA